MIVMFHALGHLLQRAFVRCYLFLGTSPGGIGAQVFLLLATEIHGGWWRLRAWKESWRGGLKRGALALLTVWFSVFAICIVKTVYDNHESLVSANQSLMAQNDHLRVETDEKDQQIQKQTREMQSLKEQIQKQPPRQVGTPPAPPVLTGIRIASQRRIPSDDPKLPFGLEVVIQTDAQIEPVAIAVICDGPIGRGNAGFANGGMYMMTNSGIAEGHPNIFLAEWKEPAWTPEQPIVVALFSQTAINAVSVSRINYKWP
jgi:hypothetical protein